MTIKSLMRPELLLVQQLWGDISCYHRSKLVTVIYMLYSKADGTISGGQTWRRVFTLMIDLRDLFAQRLPYGAGGKLLVQSVPPPYHNPTHLRIEWQSALNEAVIWQFANRNHIFDNVFSDRKSLQTNSPVINFINPSSSWPGHSFVR